MSKDFTEGQKSLVGTAQADHARGILRSAEYAEHDAEESGPTDFDRRAASEETSLNSWEVLKSEYIYEHEYLTVRKERLRIPTGAVIEDYFVLEYPAWVTVVALTSDDQLVMVRQYRHGLSAIHCEIPGGVVDVADRDPLAAARRELLEETGYGGGEWSPLLISSANPSILNNLTYSFLATGVERIADPMQDTSEDLRTFLLPITEISSLIEAGEIIQALHLAPLLKYLLSRAR